MPEQAGELHSRHGTSNSTILQLVMHDPAAKAWKDYREQQKVRQGEARWGEQYVESTITMTPASRATETFTPRIQNPEPSLAPCMPAFHSLTRGMTDCRHGCRVQLSDTITGITLSRLPLPCRIGLASGEGRMMSLTSFACLDLDQEPGRSCLNRR